MILPNKKPQIYLELINLIWLWFVGKKYNTMYAKILEIQLKGIKIFVELLSTL